MRNQQSTLQQRVRARLHGLFVGTPAPGQFQDLTWPQQFFHFWLLTARSFVKNRLPVRAASLSYTTLLALVPMLAVAVGITSSLLKDQIKDEGEDRIGQFVDRLVENLIPPAAAREPRPAPAAAPDRDGTDETALAESAGAVAAEGEAAGRETREVLGQDHRDRVAGEIKNFIQNTRSGTLGVIGSTVLIFMAISMLIRIEDAFNDIWGAVKGRSPFMRLVLYWTVITLAPVVMVVAVGLAGGAHIQATQRLIEGIPLVGWLLFQVLPLLLLCLTCATFYMLMPNTSVQWQAALVGGSVAALLWHANNSLSALYVTRVATNWKIYGGLGLVPVFMIGLYFAWIILLFGGQVSYAWQNRVAYLQDRAVENVNQRGREFVALRLMTAIAAAFQRGAPPPTLDDLAHSLRMPRRLAQQILDTLAAVRLVNEVAGHASAYVPSRPLESITCHDVLEALRAGQGSDLRVRDEEWQREVYGEFQRIYEAERHAAETVSLLALAHRANTLALPQGAGAKVTND